MESNAERVAVRTRSRSFHNGNIEGEERMLKIHGVPISVHTRKVIVAAIEKRIDYENDPVIPFNPPAGWDELSPTGKIPVAADGDFIMRDSSVICAYLERTHPDRPIYPSDARDFAQALWFEEYADGTVFREVVHGLFFQNVIRPKILKQPTDTNAIAAILDGALPKVYGYLDRMVAGAYLAGGRFGIADIAMLSNLINVHYLGYRIDANRYPRLATYFAGGLRQPSIATALRGERSAATGMGLDLTFLRERAAS
jgi:glutathione S-transferase